MKHDNTRANLGLGNLVIMGASAKRFGPFRGPKVESEKIERTRAANRKGNKGRQAAMPTTERVRICHGLSTDYDVPNLTFFICSGSVAGKPAKPMQELVDVSLAWLG